MERGGSGVRVRDVNFDGIVEDFETDIYGSSKGRVRLEVLWDDLVRRIPLISTGGLRILDAGGGSGHMAVRLATLGHSVVVCDVSEEILSVGRQRAAEAGVANSVEFLHCSIQDLPQVLAEKFDVVMCHAVLEWLADPQTALPPLAGLMKPEGFMSVMFYNKQASVLKRALAGEFEQALSEHTDQPLRRGWSDGAVALSDQAVRGWLQDQGMVVRSKAGIRVFHDHIPEDLRPTERLDTLIELEQQVASTEPFASLGQHTHLICVPQAKI